MRRIFLLAAAAALAACGGEASLGGGLPSEARRAVADMAADYERGKADDFLANVDQDRFPDAGRFMEGVRQFLLKRRQIVLDIRPDRINMNGQEAGIPAQWSKSFTDETGAVRLLEGRCEFLLRRRSSGSWALQGIRGDNPF